MGLRRRRQPSSSWEWPMALVLTAILLPLVGLAACSGGDDDSTSADADAESASSPAGETTTTEQETTSTTYASVEDEIEARYTAFWDARFEANSPPNPNDPALREYATGEQLDNVIAETQANLDDGVEFRQAENPTDFRRVDVLDVSGDTAIVQDCVVSDGVVFRSDTGEVIDDRVTTYNIEGELRRVDGEWRVARTTRIQSWNGVAGCALAR